MTMRLKSFDNYLMSVMALVALFSLFMLYGTRFFRTSNDSEIKVAQIVEQIKTVKRKRSFYQSWMDVNQGENLAQDDEIYTHGQSSAKIEFVNGPQVTLFENSLLRIKNEKLLLDKGNLSAKLTSDSPKLNISLGGKVYAFESKSANIQVEQGKSENKFILLEGAASLKVGDKKETISTDQVLIQDKESGAIKIKAIPFKLQSPAANLTQYFTDSATVDFKWKEDNVAGSKLIVARDANFTQTITTDGVKSLSLNEEGTYYWKVQSTNAEDAESPIRSFTLKKERPLPVSANKTIVYKGPKVSPKVFISWPKENAKSFELKINDNTPVKLTKNSYELKMDNLGDYQIRVKIADANRTQAVWSEPVVLKVLEEKAVTLTTTLPATIEKINYEKKPLIHLLNWDGPTEDFSYTVTLANNKTSKKFTTTSTNFPLSLSEAGEYTWKIQGTSASGVLTNEISGNVILKKPIKLMQSPSEGAIIELEKPDQLVNFKWDQVEKNQIYNFEISNDENFRKIILGKEVKTNSVSTTINETGKYFWRVKMKKGSNFEYSAPVSVEIKPTPPLERPDVAPNLKIKIKFLEEQTNFNLLDLFFAKAVAADQVAVAEWDLPANNRAKKYIVEVYKDENLKTLVTKFETDSAHVIWKKAEPGTYYWRVSYEDYWGRKTEFSKISTLSLELEEKLPIELNLPKHKAELFEKITDTAVFNWDAIPDQKIYQLEMAGDLDFSLNHTIRKVSGNEVELKCSDLNVLKGDHYWKVTTANGNTSKRRSFHSECEPPKVEVIPAPEPEAEQERVPEKVAAAQAPEVKRQISRRFARILYSPYHLSYKNTAPAYSATVSGNTINSWQGAYQQPSDYQNFKYTRITLGVSRGKVFDKITFTDLDLNLLAALETSSFNWGPTFSLMKRTSYVESNLAINSAGASQLAGGAFIEKSSEFGSIMGQAMFGQALFIHAEILINFKKNYSAGPFFDSLSFTKDGKHSYTKMGLNVAYTFPLLENP